MEQGRARLLFCTAVQKVATSATRYLEWHTLFRDKWIASQQNCAADSLVFSERVHSSRGKKMGANGPRTACVLHSSAEIGDFGDGLSRIAHSLAGEVDWITAEFCSGHAGFLTTDPFLSEKNIAANGPKTMEVWHNRAEICNFGDGSLRVVHFLSGTADRITAEFRSGYAGFLSADSVLSERKAGGNEPRTMEV